MAGTHDPSLLARAAGPGRIRGIALDAWEAARAEPHRAGAVLRAAMRDARALHSRERRLVADVLYDLIRHEAVLARALDTDAPEVLWTGALLLTGLAVDAAPAGTAWDRVADLDTARRAATVDLDDLPALAVVAGVPEPVAAELRRTFGARAEAVIDASNARAPVALRARDDREALIARLAEEGVEAVASPVAPQAVRVVGRANLQALPSFRAGRFEVQDEGSQRLAELVAPAGTVVDFCAGAGGKTLALARPGVRLVALDVRRRALDELRRRARRAGVRVRVHAIDDGPLPPEVARVRADRVLVDAPCSGTGTWRRHPELRWRLEASRLEELGALQRRILARAAELVKPGGRLVYGTCSLLRRENEDVVDDFLAATLGFTPGEVLRLDPDADDTDGFFGAVLHRAGG